MTRHFNKTEDARQNDEMLRPMRFRSIIPVIKAAGLAQWTGMFVALFLIASTIVMLVEPGVGHFRDATWLMFQAVTTIGFGDYTCVTMAGRVACVVLSLYSVIYLALITGAIVSYCTERMRYRRDQSVAHFLDQLEHLPELSHEELVEISDKVKRL